MTSSLYTKKKEMSCASTFPSSLSRRQIQEWVTIFLICGHVFINCAHLFLSLTHHNQILIIPKWKLMYMSVLPSSDLFFMCTFYCCSWPVGLCGRPPWFGSGNCGCSVDSLRLDEHLSCFSWTSLAVFTMRRVLLRETTAVGGSIAWSTAICRRVI